MVHRSNGAAAKDAEIRSSREEYASNMEHRSNLAASKDAQIKLEREECASSMGQKLNNANNAAAKDVQIKFKTEECASNTEQSSNDAALMDALMEPSREESAEAMGQRSDAVLKDAQIILKTDE